MSAFRGMNGPSSDAAQCPSLDPTRTLSHLCGYSGFMLAARITLPHFSTSVAM
jgi:hypothetical protein